ncbi:phosphotransferase [Streptomyces sp. NPDC007164]|uniref:phosphotransferase n=1 Tax=Streptomyces sp. NPDC007164 TaxID=3156918 RepID=UPI0033F3710A
MTGNGTEARTIVAADGGKQVLVHGDGGQWSLPRHPGGGPERVRTVLRERWGGDTVRLGTLVDTGSGPEAGLVYAHQWCAETAAAPGSTRWVSASDVGALTGLDPVDRALAEGWFSGEFALPDVPWTRPGWYAEATGWLTARLSERGTGLTGPVEQFLVSPWACTLRAPTDEGHVFLKAAPPGFPHEAVLTQRLGTWFPDNIVPVIAVQPEHGWLLSADIGDCTFIEDVTAAEDLPRYRSSVQRYAQMQQSTTERITELAELGVPDRRPGVLPGLFERMLAEPERLGIGQEWGLTAEEHRRLLDFRAEFARRCAELAAVGLPDVLVNIDFWHGNVSFRPQGDIFFDWAETGIGHPLCGMTTVLREFEQNEIADGERVRQELTDAYLDRWTPYVSRDRITDAYPLGQQAAIVWRAWSWRDCVVPVPAPERHDGFRHAVAANLRRLLAFVD